MTLYTNSFTALERIVNLRLIFFESLAETVASVAVVALGAGAAGAAFGRAIGYFSGALIAVAVDACLLGRSTVQPFARGSGRTRDIALYAASLFIANSAYTFYASIDVLLIGALVGDNRRSSLLRAPPSCGATQLPWPSACESAIRALGVTASEAD